MRKTVEIEYVGIEDVMELIEDAYELQKEGHYVSVELMECSGEPMCRVVVQRGGFDESKSYDIYITFYISDDGYNVQKMNEAKCYLKNLLTEE